jgi:NADH-quinone oxidoreductase subunit N
VVRKGRVYRLSKTIPRAASPRVAVCPRSYTRLTWRLFSTNVSKYNLFYGVASVLISWRVGDVVSLLFLIALGLIYSSNKPGPVSSSQQEKHRMISGQTVWILCVSLAAGVSSLQTAAAFLHQQYIVSDFYAEAIKIYLVFFTIVFLLVTLEFLLKYSELKKVNLIEFPLVICFALFFMLLLVSSFNVFGAYLSLEGLTFSLYLLAGMNYNAQNSLEAGIKYFCLGALSSGFLLFGVALVFIMTKTLDFSELRFLFNGVGQIPLLLSFALIFIFFGFWFKLSIFPCHAWTPDVYEGVLSPVTLFFATIVKLCVFSFFVRVLFFLLGGSAFIFFWQPLFLLAAAGSIVFGALGALLQTKLKRFIGYTSINQMGYLFIGVSSGDLLGLQASFLYLFFYLIMGFSFFSILLHVSNKDTGKEVLFVNQLGLLGLQHRNLAAILAVVLFSMAGVPPLSGFFGKFFLFFSAFQAGNHGLVFLGLVMNVVSAFYYLRIVKCIFFDARKAKTPFFFFAGMNSFSAGVFNLFLGTSLFLLVVSPFFLNALLLSADGLAFSASRVPLGFW